MTKTKKRFPDTIFVYKELDGDEEYFVTSDELSSLANLDEDRIVGIYTLKEIKTLQTEVKLV